MRTSIKAPYEQIGSQSQQTRNNDGLSALTQQSDESQDEVTQETTDAVTSMSDGSDTEPRAYSSLNSGGKDLPRIRKSTRERKPVLRFTYDQPGNPTEESVTIVHQGMIIQLDLGPNGRNVKLSAYSQNPSTRAKYL